MLDESTRGRLTVAVPELVLREAVNKWAEGVAGLERQRRESLKNLARRGVSVDPAPALDTEALQRDEDARVRGVLKLAGVEIVAFPQVGHAAVSDRALQRRRPFDKEGKVGYRDTLIWETVLELAQTQDVVFATNDGSGFFDSKADRSLAKQLRFEAEQRCGRSNPVMVYRSLEEAIDAALARTREADAWREEISRERAELEEVQAQLDTWLGDRSFRAHLRDSLSTVTQGQDLTGQLDRFGVHADVYEATVDNVDWVDDLTLRLQHTTADGIALAQATATLLLRVELDVHPAEASAVEETGLVTITDFGYDSHRAEGYANWRARGHYDVTIDPDDGSVESALLIGLGPAEPDS